MRYSLLLFSIFYSCTYNELVPVCEPDNQIFSNSVQAIIEDKCMGCHNSTPPVLATYEDAIDAINNYSLEDQVVSFQMPPDGSLPLSNTEINIITKWVNCE